MTDRFVARNPSDLIALAPLLLGFHPQDSVVLMTFGPPGGAFHARIDLPMELDAQHEVAGLLTATVLRHRLGTAAVLIFSSDTQAATTQAVLLRDALVDAGVDVVDVLRVEPDRYYRVLEDDEVGAPYDICGHPFTAQRVFEGQVVQPSREALADTLIGTDEEDAAAVAASAATYGEDLLDARTHRVERAGRAEAIWMQGRIRRHVREDRLLDAEEAGQMLFLCGFVALRDVAWAEMTRGDAAQHVEFWRDLVRRAPVELLPGPACLMAFAAWLAGDGALAWCGVERCAEADPDYSMAHCLTDLLQDAVPPSVWPGIPERELPALRTESPEKRAG